ncbi:MAG: EAL domain-containing protein [Zoogloeaceae bacterium]|nr:EAL domain-containing protein [Zoogloeaceae bacterium]
MPMPLPGQHPLAPQRPSLRSRASALLAATLCAPAAWAGSDGPALHPVWVASMGVAVAGALVWGWSQRRRLRECQGQGRIAELALEYAGDGLWDWDLATNAIQYSNSWPRLLGTSPGEMGTSPGAWHSRIHPSDVESHQAALAAHLAGHAADFRCEHRLLAAGGAYVWVLARGRVVTRNSSGRALRIVGTLVDVTARREAEEALRTREATLQSVLSALGEGVLMRDNRGRTLLSNPAAARVLGLPATEVAEFDLPKAALRFFREDGSPCPADDLTASRSLADGRPHRAVVGLQRQDGSRAWLLARSEPVTTGTPPHQIGVVTTLADITQLRETEDALHLADTVFHNSVEAIIITGPDLKILRVNPAFTHATGYRPEDVIGESPSVLRSGRHDAAFYRAMWESIDHKGSWQGEIWNRRKDGSVYPEWLSITAVRDHRGRLTHYIAVFNDMTERKAQEAQIAFLAHHDPLTSLPNRALMIERIDRRILQAQREHSRFALLFLDLDHFKHINDSLGHTIGDLLLKDIAQRLVACVRASDSVGRLGGDEFLILLSELADAADAAQVASKVIDAMAPTFEIDGHALATSASIGVAVHPADGKDALELMRSADTAMYHAKSSGRNAFRFFTETMNAAAMERLVLDNAMRQALERDEFHLVYQPQICLATGRITGMEALLRWTSATYGDVPPSRFIPLAEDNGQIIPIGRWVLAQACRQACQWQREGRGDIPVAVNLSALQFRRDDIVQLVHDTLRESGLAPHLLELELTESLLLEQGSEALDTITRLKAAGIRISIDDFGTGYSSLSYIKRFRVDRLKIDRSFIRDIDADLDDAEIVRAIIQLGHVLRMEVVAEGVETPFQLNFLREEGCESAQGYLFARPRPPKEAFDNLVTPIPVEYGAPAAQHCPPPGPAANLPSPQA